jgi:hypothetical protein
MRQARCPAPAAKIGPFPHDERDTCGSVRTLLRNELRLPGSSGCAHPRGLKETAVDWNAAQANWIQFRDEVHANWAMLTSRQLDLIAGRRASLAYNIAEAYGVACDEAERQIKSFESRNVHARAASLR